MGKHKEKKRKSQKKKKEKKHKRKYNSSSSSESDEWVEKESVQRTTTKAKQTYKRRYTESESSEEELIKKNSRKNWKDITSSSSSDEDKCKKQSEDSEETSEKNEQRRDEWMNLSTSFSSTSHLDRRREREIQKQKDREKQMYNPSTCSRELNPYWKDGGDGLPKFRKPADEDDDRVTFDKSRDQRSNKYSERTESGWRKIKNTERAASIESKPVIQQDAGDGLSKFRKPADEDDNRVTFDSSRDQRSNKYSGRTESGWRKSKNTERAASIETKPVVQEDADEKVAKSEEYDTSVMSDKELNMLASKLVKAEIMGNAKLAEQLKKKLDEARKLKESHPNTENSEEVILTHTDSKGYSRPVRMQSEYDRPSGSKEKKQKVDTHKEGQRVRYFADDDKYSLQQMFENEKYSSIEDQNREFLKMASKIRKNDDLDEVFEDKIRHKESEHKIDERNRDRAVGEHRQMSKSLDNCNKCIQSDNMFKHLMISLGETVYISLPHHEPLAEGHCLLIPIRHTTCATQLDENEWQELLDFRKAVTKMFNSNDEDVIFFEMAVYLNRFPHMSLECIPVPREQGDLAPIYFKKAIDESEFEWSQNKKLVSLKGRDVRKAIPKGLPYFSVSFGMEEGYAHVIEDEKHFPQNFAQEIIGGMMDLDHSKWRKPKRQSFDEQSKRVTAFSKMWSQFDITNSKV